MLQIPKGGVFRIAAAMLLCAVPAFGSETEAPQETTLAVSVSVPTVAEALDVRDLEHFVVSELKHNRFDAVALTSLQTRPDSEKSLYLVEIGIDQADVAQRPIRVLGQTRFRDDEILHVELSLAVSHGDDALGSLYRSYDLRAEDYGRFSSPENIRGAVYESLSKLASDFATGVEHGDFADLDSFQHPFGSPDAMDLWNQFPAVGKFALAFVTFLFLVGCLGIVFRVTRGVFGLFAPRRPAPQYVVVRDERPSPAVPAMVAASAPGVVIEGEE